MRCIKALPILFVTGLLFICLPGEARELKETPEVSIRDQIREIESQTSFRFLYRDALIAGKRVARTVPDPEGTWMQVLETRFREIGIGVEFDLMRFQILLFEVKSERTPVQIDIRGRVLDAETGEPLPFANIVWSSDSGLRGIHTDSHGNFQIPQVVFEEGKSRAITASYIGYKSMEVHLHSETLVNEAVFMRLLPDPVMGSTVVIFGSHFLHPSDTLVSAYTKIGRFASFGEGSALRSLMPLASVGLTGAASNGLNVRGSTSDAVQITLDGITIYNQNHLFGMFDPFNRDALSHIGYYYDVAPASVAGTPGATIAYNTRTGSRTGFLASAGVSNSAVRGTFEGPVRDGAGSWLVSGRHSYLNSLDWFGNQKLISWGLNVDRQTERPANGLTDITSQTVFPQSATARFYDLHGKFTMETSDRGTYSFSLYLGGDETFQAADRFRRVVPNLPAMLDRFELERMETENRWGTQAIAGQHHIDIGNRQILSSRVSINRYNARFSKEDFLYTRFVPGVNEFRFFLNDFQHNNNIVEVIFAQDLFGYRSSGSRFSLGWQTSVRDVNYNEYSPLRPDYTLKTFGVQNDIYGQYDYTSNRNLHVLGGLRLHHYSLGNYLRLSPRLQLRILPENRISFSAGYSRKHQFLHSISLRNYSSAQVWVSSLSYQKPTVSDQLSASTHIRPWTGGLLQIEGYHKFQKYVRAHEINNSWLRRENIFLESPWFYDNDLRARGLEVQFYQALRRAGLTLSYTYAIAEIRNSEVQSGEWFYTEWDRRNQLFAGVQLPLGKFAEANFSWIYATGSPGYEDLDFNGSRTRLPDYSRFDVGITTKFSLQSAKIEAGVSVFNVFDRNNSWYRGPVMVADRTQRPFQLRFMQLDVYDLGFQPSFDISVRF